MSILPWQGWLALFLAKLPGLGCCKSRCRGEIDLAFDIAATTVAKVSDLLWVQAKKTVLKRLEGEDVGRGCNCIFCTLSADVVPRSFECT